MEMDMVFRKEKSNAPKYTWKFVDQRRHLIILTAALLAIAASLTVAADATTSSRATRIRPGDYPASIVFGVNGDTAYVANRNNNSVSIIDVKDSKVVDTIRGISKPCAMAVDRRHDAIYVSGTNGIAVIDTRTHKVVTTIPKLNSQLSFAINPSGKYLFSLVAAWQYCWDDSRRVSATTNALLDP
jgi:YVTN family beta-propeller protein